MKKFYTVCLLWLGVVAISSGQTGTITGRVVDATNSEGLPNANVFIDQTTFGVAADIDGYFVFRNVPVGTASLVFSFVGYKTYQSAVTVQLDKSTEILIRLQPLQEELAEVEVKGKKDKKWESDLRKFRRYFFGDDAVGASCTISNPWVLEFSRDPGNNDFLATASQPLEIINPALGYELTYTLREFRFSEFFYRIAGYAQFREMASPDPKTALEQFRNRKESYVYSDRYFFKSFLDGKLEENGFRLYVEKAGMQVRRTNVFSVEMSNTLTPWKPLPLELDQPGIYRVRMPAKLEVHNNRLNSDRRAYTDITHAVSWMEVRGGFVLINRQGVPVNAGVLINSGEMNTIRIGRLLPLNYSPDESIQLPGRPPVVRHERLREKAWVITDREYYHPGENVRIKVCMNYGEQSMRDSLSSVLVAELFNSERQLLLQEKLAIDSGFAYGSIRLPDTLRHSVAYLRVYTNWMRNYGSGVFSVTPIPVLSRTESPIAADIDDKGESFEIGFDPKSNSIRIGRKDSAADDSSYHLAVSIVNGAYAVQVVSPEKFKESFKIRKSESIPHMDFTFPVRHDLALSGRALGPTGKPVLGRVTAIVGNQAQVHLAETDAKGRFLLDSLLFADSVQVATQVQNRRGKLEGMVQWDEPDTPAADFQRIEFPIRTKPVDAKEFVPDPASRVLKQVTVVEQAPAKKESQPYGKPDHVITGDQLLASKTGASLIASLQGKVPGMQIISSFDNNGARYKIIMRGGTTSILGSLEPVVFINGVPATSSDGSAASVLEQINPIDVERIEIITRINAMMGALGSNGLIAVYTKVGVSTRLAENGFKIQVFKGLQFYQSGTYGWMESGNGDTYYWHPALQITAGTNGLLIPAKSLAPGKYMVRVAGLTSDNKPVAGVRMITIP